MTDYIAPIADMRFVLEHVVDVASLAKLPGFEHAEPDMVAGLLEEAGRFMSEVIAPLNRVGDQIGSRAKDGIVTTPPGFKEAYKKYAEGGWSAVPFDPAYGGGGLPWAVALAVQEMLTSANMAFSLCPLLTQSAVEMLAHHGSETQRETYLPRLVSGEWTGTMNLSEPQAGSDLGAVRTRAEQAEDGSWRVFGTKIFITWGEHDVAENVIHLVLARAPGGPAGTKGISCFLVPKFLVNADGSLGARNDATCVSVEHKLGIHASPTCVMAYGENGGAVAELIGEPHEGMRYMFTMMNNARLSVALEGLAISERAYQQALAYAKERRQGRAIGAARGAEQSPIIDHADVRRMLLTMKVYIEAMRVLLYMNGAALDRASAHPDDAERARAAGLAALLTPVSKAWSTDLGVELTSLAIQVHGGVGFVEETGVAQHYRDARIAPIYEGTNGIQAADLVGRKLPLDGGAVVRAYLEEMRALDAALSSAGDVLGSMRPLLAAAVGTLTIATEWMLGADARDAAAGSTPYLRMFGVVAGGYYLARSALAAARLLEQGAADRSFLEAKVSTADFYAHQVLPLAAALLPAAMGGADALFSAGL